MDVSGDAVKEVKAFRAVNDPIILHERTMDWFDGQSTPSEEDIYEARLELVEEHPDDERIPKATWAEVVAYCFTASMDAASINADFVGIYQYAFTQFLEQDIGGDADEILPDSFGFYPGVPQTDEPVDPDELSDSATSITGVGMEEHLAENGGTIVAERHKELAKSLREDIKQDLDEHFVSSLYAELPFETSVPKVFWKDAAVAVTDDGGGGADEDGGSQAGLDMF